MELRPQPIQRHAMAKHRLQVIHSELDDLRAGISALQRDHAAVAPQEAPPLSLPGVMQGCPVLQRGLRGERAAEGRLVGATGGARHPMGQFAHADVAAVGLPERRRPEVSAAVAQHAGDIHPGRQVIVEQDRFEVAVEHKAGDTSTVNELRTALGVGCASREHHKSLRTMLTAPAATATGLAPYRY